MSERREVIATGRHVGRVVVATMLLGAVVGAVLGWPAGASSAEPAASPAPKSADGGAVSGEEAKAVAEKRRTESEGAAANIGVQKLAKGPHGAMPVAEQIALLDKLQLPTDATIPPGIDPVVWQSLVPKDNEINAARIATPASPRTARSPAPRVTT
jgi:hypothetical protein